jgi:hypothetical protein
MTSLFITCSLQTALLYTTKSGDFAEPQCAPCSMPCAIYFRLPSPVSGLLSSVFSPISPSASSAVPHSSLL